MIRCHRCKVGFLSSWDLTCAVCMNIPDHLMQHFERHHHTLVNFRVDSPETSLQFMLSLMTLSEVCKMREELRRMADTQQEQDAKLTSDVESLMETETTMEATLDGIKAELDALKNSPVAADPAVAGAITNIEALQAKMLAKIASVAAPATGTTDPAPVVTDPGTPVVTDGSTGS